MVYKRNLCAMDWTEMGHGEKFLHHRKTLTPYGESYMPKLGVTLYRLEPGKRAFPFHRHLANDEAILVTKGAGVLRYGAEEHPLQEGDYVHLPAAGDNAHQVINTSNGALEYLCFSSMQQPDVVVYPDSNKVGAFAFKPGAQDPKNRFVAFLRNQPVDYWDGEGEK